MKEIILILIFLATAYLTVSFAQSRLKIIPEPDSIIYKEGTFTLSSATTITHDKQFFKLAVYLSQQLDLFTKVAPAVMNSNVTMGSNIISLGIDSASVPSNTEGYLLDISHERVVVRARTEAGLFIAIQTLLQIFPVADSDQHILKYIVPCCTITDYPRFSWRGMNLDCCRHFFTKDFIKRYIDLLALYKFNIFHWHLTDDQGWRIEIKKYPRLTQIGGWRADSGSSAYGGFYTQEEIKEIVAYAQSRYITVIPEIEMPGHCTASLAAYPENSCTGGPFEVATAWGVFRDVYCAGKESTFAFLQDVLAEVMDLFPSHYIHIGGDEVPKYRWEACPYCQKRIKDEGLKNEDELQSYFVKRIAKFVESKGREIIGWDEILQGGIAAGPVIQSWRGIDGAVQAARSKHYTIVSPGDYTYFDNSVNELSIDTVYSFDPMPSGLDTDQAQYILGTEANIWTEHITQDSIDMKAFPRLLALSEDAWTQPGKKDFANFHDRLVASYDRLNFLGVEYGLEKKAILYVTKVDTVSRDFVVNLNSTQANTQIRYTLDGTIPTLRSPLYEDPITFRGAAELIARCEMKGRLVGDAIDLAFIVSKAIGASVTLKNQYSWKYTAGGPGCLVDGIRGTIDYHDGLWQGYQGVDVDAVLDLGAEKEISQAGAGFYQDLNSWIFMPDSVEFFTSNDGTNYTKAGEVKNEIPQNNSATIKKDFTVSFEKRKARYIRMIAHNIGICPPWHEGAGGKAWLFIDEVYAN